MTELNVQETLQRGIKAARRGHKEPAQKLLNQVVQADPNSEEAWLWLARVVDDPLQKAECLQRVLTINPGNQWAAEQLTALQAAPAPVGTPKPPPTPTSSDIKLQTLNCPNCGGSVELQGGSKIQMVVCNYCGSVLDLTPEQANIIGETDPKVKPVKPIELGMQGTFLGQQHQVVGWVRYEGWDDEEKWQWDEWLLAGAKGGFLWLSYDSDAGFVLYKAINPREPFDPKTTTSIKVPGGVAHVIERAKARIVALAGELTWRGKVGDEIKYIDAKRGNNPYSVEYSRDEIELLEGHRLSEAQVWKAFGREDMRQQIGYGPALDRDKLMAAEIDRQKSRRRSNRQMYIIIAIVALFIIFACLCSRCSGSGTVFPSVRSGSVSGPSTGGGFNFGK